MGLLGLYTTSKAGKTGKSNEIQPPPISSPIKTKEERKVFFESFKKAVNKQVKIDVYFLGEQNENIILGSKKLSFQEIKNGLNEKVISGLREFGFKQIVIQIKNKPPEFIKIEYPAFITLNFAILVS